MENPPGKRVPQKAASKQQHFFWSCFLVLFFLFSLLASWLLGFLASWLFGFGFSHPLHSQWRDLTTDQLCLLAWELQGIQPRAWIWRLGGPQSADACVSVGLVANISNDLDRRLLFLFLFQKPATVTEKSDRNLATLGLPSIDLQPPPPQCDPAEAPLQQKAVKQWSTPRTWKGTRSIVSSGPCPARSKH